MSTQLQLRKGNTAQTAVFTGAVAEVTVDTDKNIVVVHDGVTVGGHPSITVDTLNSANSFLQSNDAVTLLTSKNYTDSANTQLKSYVDTGISVQHSFSQASFDKANTNASAITVIQGVDNTQNTNITTVTNVAASAYNQANTGTTLAQASFNVGNTTNAYAQAAYGQANTNASAISTIQSVDNTQNTNIASVTSTAAAAYNQANTGTTIAQAAYSQANTNTGAISIIQSVNTTQNTNISSTDAKAQAAYGQANTNALAITVIEGVNTTQNTNISSADAKAQAAFNTANTKFNSAGGTISGDTVVTGNLTVSGTTLYANVTNIVVEDNVITLNSNVTGTPTQNAGIEVNRGTSSNTSVIWNEGDKAWELTNDGTTFDKITTNSVLAANVSYLQGIEDSQNAYSQAAFSQANTNAGAITVIQGVDNTQNTNISNADTKAQAAFDAGNTTNTYAQSAYAKANTNASDILVIQGVDNTQNSVISNVIVDASAAFIKANAAFNSSNTVGDYATSGYAKANSATTLAQASYDAGNTTLTYAQSAYAKANAANVFAQSVYDSSNTKFSSSGGTINGNVEITGHANVNSYLVVGTGAPAILPNLVAQFTGTSDLYSQVNNQNLSGNGTSDVVITADNGTDLINYLDMGLAGSTYKNTNYNSWSFVNPNDAYLVLQGNAGQNFGGNVFIGTAGSGQTAYNTQMGDIVFIQGPDVEEVARFKLGQGLVVKTAKASTSNSTGSLVIEGGVGVQGEVHADSVYAGNVNLKSYIDTANTFLQANDATTLASAKSYTDTANTSLKSYVDNAISNTNTYSQSGFAHANAAYTQANTGTTLTQASFDAGNTTLIYAQSAYSKANTDGVLAQASFDKANTVAGDLATANTFLQANDATTLLSAQNYTDSANTKLKSYVDNSVSTANTSLKSYVDGQVIVINSNISANLSTAEVYTDTANTKMKSYVDSGISTVTTYSQYGFSHANAAFNKANTVAGDLATANTFLQANDATTLASAKSYTDTANTYLDTIKFNKSGGTISGDTILSANLTISGNLIVTGNVTTTEINNVSLANSIIYLAKDNAANLVDIGVVGSFTQGSYQHTGVVRDNADGKWKFFSNVVNEPTSTIDFTGALYDTIKVGGIESPTATINGIELGAFTSSSFNKANNSGVVAQASFDSGNTTLTYAQSAYASGNTTLTYSQAGYAKANNSGVVAQSAFDSSNSVSSLNASINATQNTNIANADTKSQAAFDSGNTTLTYAQSSYSKANADGVLAQSAFDAGNTTNAYATAGYGKANSSNVLAQSAYTQANTGTILAQASFDAGNTTLIYAQSAYTSSNTNASAITVLQAVNVTQNTNITNVDTKAQAAFDSGNTTSAYATAGFSKANSATTLSQAAFDSGNTTLTYATAGFTKANNSIQSVSGTSGRITSSTTGNTVIMDLSAIAGLSAGTYSYPQLQIDSYGRVVTISNQTPVTSWNGMTGAVTLSSANVTSALGYTPATSTFAQAAYDSGNTTLTYAQSSYAKANTDGVIAQAAFDSGNTTLVYAQSAYSAANGKFSSSGGTISGDTVVTGNLTVTGTRFYANTVSLVVEDNIITINSNVTGTPTLNAGIEVNRGSLTNTSILWNETDKSWEFTNDGTNYNKIATSDYANAAYSKANTSGLIAQAAFDSGNTTLVYAQAAYNKANTITLVGPITLTNNTYISDANTKVAATTANTIIDTYSISTYRTVKYLIQATNPSVGAVHATELLVTHNNSQVYTNEYGTIKTGTSLFTLETSIDSSNVYLMITTTNANTDVQFAKTSLISMSILSGSSSGDMLSLSGTEDLSTSTGSEDLNV